MKFDKFAQITGIAAVLLLMPAVAALPAGLPVALAQIAPSGYMLGLGDAMTASSNHTGMTFLTATGMSMVKGVRVTGIILNDNDTVSVTLTNTNKTGEPAAVKVMAASGTMNIMSALSGSFASMTNESSFGNSSISSMPNNTNHSGIMIGSSNSSASNNTFGNSSALGSSINPFSFFENLKNGSSTVPQSWNSPANVTIRLVGNNTAAMTPNEGSDMTFVFVTVLPSTEGATGAARATTGG